MKALTSLKDIALVARFELLRNLKTLRALALIMIYLLATGGSAFIFTRVLLSMENNLAAMLKVPKTEVPGAMIQEVVKDGAFKDVLSRMVGGEAYIDYVLNWPVLVIFHVWIGTLFIPFLAASTSAESIVLDTSSRAARFECLRTGRVEFVSGRLLGQLFLMMIATVFSVLATFTVGMVYMVGNDPVGLMTGLLGVTPRIWAVALPFLGIGIFASQVAPGVNMARVIALGTVAFTWFLTGLATLSLENGGSAAWDVLLQVMPQSYMDGLWAPFPAWAGTSGWLAVLGIAAMGLGLPYFLRRDL